MEQGASNPVGKRVDELGVDFAAKISELLALAAPPIVQAAWRSLSPPAPSHWLGFVEVAALTPSMMSYISSVLVLAAIAALTERVID